MGKKGMCGREQCPSSPLISGYKAAVADYSDARCAAWGVEGTQGPGVCSSEGTHTLCITCPGHCGDPSAATWLWCLLSLL